MRFRLLFLLLFCSILLTASAPAQVQFFPPLQQTIFVIEGSPEGRVFMDVGILLVDRNSGKLWQKRTTRDLSTGWVDLGSGSGATGTALSFSSQFGSSGVTNITIASGASITNANLLGATTAASIGIGATNVIGALSTKAELTSPSFTTPTLGVATSTTLDTGQGANELYDMDQNVLATSAVTFTNIYLVPLVVAYASAIVVDFSGAGDLWTVLGGNTTLSSSGLAAGRGITYRIDNQTATNCSVILPATWRFVSGTTNNILATGKIGLLSIKSYAANDTNVVCLWASE